MILYLSKTIADQKAIVSRLALFTIVFLSWKVCVSNSGYYLSIWKDLRVEVLEEVFNVHNKVLTGWLDDDDHDEEEDGRGFG